MSIFFESLPAGIPVAIACVAGFLLGLRLRRPAFIGQTLVFVSFGLIIAILFVVPLFGDCHTESGHVAIAVSAYASLGLSWLMIFGAGMLAAKVWKTNLIGGLLCIAAIVLVGMPFNYMALFMAAFKPGCYV